jgi:hypothetical protein
VRSAVNHGTYWPDEWWSRTTRVVHKGVHNGEHIHRAGQHPGD